MPCSFSSCMVDRYANPSYLPEGLIGVKRIYVKKTDFKFCVEIPEEKNADKDLLCACCPLLVTNHDKALGVCAGLSSFLAKQ